MLLRRGCYEHEKQKTEIKLVSGGINIPSPPLPSPPLPYPTPPSPSPSPLHFIWSGPNFQCAPLIFLLLLFEFLQSEIRHWILPGVDEDPIQSETNHLMKIGDDNQVIADFFNVRQSQSKKLKQKSRITFPFKICSHFMFKTSWGLGTNIFSLQTFNFD